MKYLLSLCCAVLFVSLPRAQDATKPAPPPALYPLKEGSKWVYTSGKDSIEVTVKGKEKEGMEDVYELVTSRNGVPEANEHIVVRADKDHVGVYRVKVAGVKVTPELCFLKVPVKEGEKVKPWKVSSLLGPEKLEGEFTLGEEEIELAVKDKKDKEKKKAVTVSGSDMLANGQKMSLKYYFVKNMGLVRQEASLAGSKKVTLEFKDYEPAK
jgi:hypothetical protein